MKKTLTLAVVLLAAFYVSGCSENALTTQHVPFPRTAGDFETVDNPEMARIYVARPTQIEYSLAYKVTDGKTHIADVGPYGYVCWERKPGKTYLTTSHVDGDYFRTDVTVEKGKVYYYQMYCWYSSNSNLKSRDVNDGINILRECSPPSITE